ncbi:MAG TPA: ATP-binding protein [Terriglobales bacterium]|nr:ATP-binding protein [Terriglobales bacterium]
MRNPLAPIRNAVQLLVRPTASPEMQQSARAIIDRQVVHMVRLIDDLLDVSRINRGSIALQLETILLQDLVERALEASRPLIEAGGHSLVSDVPASPILLHVDPTRIAQALSNLLNNAAKYTPAGGKIWLSARAEGDKIVIRVRDNGSGISPEILPYIFDVFMQAPAAIKRSQGGLGLGLTLVQRLVELHGGTVEAKSAGAGHGSEFAISIPRCVVLAPLSPKSDSQPETRISGVGRRILVVDDNRDSADSLAMWLRSEGHQVTVAYNGETALELAREISPELLFLDIGMPGLNGYEVARNLRQQGPQTAMVLVAMTGWSQSSDRRRAFEAGFDLHLAKPIDAHGIARAIALLPPSPSTAST